ncbi:MAG: hypothetical protein MN733_34995 [Nitrososphaera sp.]|nr:hypothetical protein [Nitrososphaera sp.]
MCIENVRFVRINASLIGVVLCSFAIGGLIFPLGSSAEASGSFAAKSGHKADGIVIKSSTDSNCLNNGKPNIGTSCKDDAATKKDPKEPDRKGHKVKKSKKRGS